jgi:tryptophan-rich sensory protein
MTLARSGRAATIAAAAGCALLVATAGGLMTELGPWYHALRTPSWKPPDWLFGPAWTLIFTTATLSGISSWRTAPDRGFRRGTVLLFGLNGVLNVLWSALFFRLQRPDWALWEVGFLWLSILWLMLRLWRPSRTASLLLLPYLAWVAVAATLTFSVVQLNAPFD